MLTTYFYKLLTITCFDRDVLSQLYLVVKCQKFLKDFTISSIIYITVTRFFKIKTSFRALCSISCLFSFGKKSFLKASMVNGFLFFFLSGSLKFEKGSVSENQKLISLSLFIKFKLAARAWIRRTSNLQKNLQKNKSDFTQKTLCATKTSRQLLSFFIFWR